MRACEIEPATMTDSEILQELTEIFRECFNDGGIVLVPATTARDINAWDSAKMVMLVLGVEERFGITMRSTDLESLRCVGDWIAIIQAHHGAA
jgi:acyl carrier protein